MLHLLLLLYYLIVWYKSSYSSFYPAKKSVFSYTPSAGKINLKHGHKFSTTTELWVIYALTKCPKTRVFYLTRALTRRNRPNQRNSIFPLIRLFSLFSSVAQTKKSQQQKDGSTANTHTHTHNQFTTNEINVGYQAWSTHYRQRFFFTNDPWALNKAAGS